jgi:hypothetical protein
VDTPLGAPLPLPPPIVIDPESVGDVTFDAPSVAPAGAPPPLPGAAVAGVPLASTWSAPDPASVAGGVFVEAVVAGAGFVELGSSTVGRALNSAVRAASDALGPSVVVMFPSPVCRALWRPFRRVRLSRVRTGPRPPSLRPTHCPHVDFATTSGVRT